MDTFYVIVMAYGNEPKRLLATAREGTVFVANDTRSEWLAYPQQFVFEDDARLFERLRGAFTSGNAKRLTELWREARQMQIPAEASA